MKKIKIPYELLETNSKKDHCPMSKIAYILKAFLETDEQINVTRIWINKETENNLKNYFLKWLEKQNRTKSQAKSQLGWYILQVGPAVDIKDEKALETDYLYYI